MPGAKTATEFHPRDFRPAFSTARARLAQRDTLFRRHVAVQRRWIGRPFLLADVERFQRHVAGAGNHEQFPTGSLVNVLMKDHGATFTQIALLTSVGGFIIPWINPVLSTWSDRHRGKYGRRRPFLFWTMPFFAIFLIAIPFMPDLFRFLRRFSWAAAVFTHLPMDGEALFIGICGLIANMFSAALLAVFSYLYWDVVPDTVMGRFQALSRTATLVAGFVWSFFVLGFADHHMKAVFAGTGVFSLVVYLVSVWQIKEGEYPPPDPHKKGGVLAPVRAYFRRMFQPVLFPVDLRWLLPLSGWQRGNWYQFSYLHYDLKMDLATVGWSQGWSSALTTCFGLIFGFAIGSLTDRLKPVRLMPFIFILLGLVMLGSFLFVHDKWTFLGWSCAREVMKFIFGVVTGAFTVEVFPREKIGQFCSAQAIFYQMLMNLTGPVMAMFFDHVHNNRLGYLWTMNFYFLAALAYAKVFLNWKRRRGQAPVPHAG